MGGSATFLFYFIQMLKETYSTLYSKFATTEAPLSHRSHCSLNASSVPCFCDMAPRQWVTHLHHTWLAARLTSENWLSNAAMLSLAVPAQACVSWPIRVDWVFRRRGLKETGDKTERFRQRGDTELQNWTVWENWCAFLNVKHVNVF